MKKIITAILATAFMAGMAMSPVHATNDQIPAEEVTFKKWTPRPIIPKVDGPCKNCRKPEPIKKPWEGSGCRVCSEKS